MKVEMKRLTCPAFTKGRTNHKFLKKFLKCQEKVHKE